MGIVIVEVNRRRQNLTRPLLSDRIGDNLALGQRRSH